MSLFRRDMLMFFRDATQWSQFIVIAALIAIYVFNFKNLPYELYGFQYSMSHISVAASGLILSALLARFAYPAVSIEGATFWLLRSAPVNWKKYLWLKFLFFLVPTLLIGFMLVGFSVVVLDVPRLLMQQCLFTIGLISVGCTGLAVGLGSMQPRFDLEDPARIAVSTGGLVFMMVSITFIIMVVVLNVIPDLLRYLSLYWRYFRYLKNMDRTAAWGGMIFLAYVTATIPMRLGIHRLKNGLSS
jgi:ABC-2 type transport system permease protein